MPWAVVLERGVVDQHVELAELVDAALHGVAAELRLPHVAGDRDGAPPFGLDRFDGGPRVLGLLGEVHDRDVGAFAREQDGDGAADAGIPAGDQRDVVLQLAGAAVVRRRELRPRLHRVLAARWCEPLRGERRFGSFAGHAQRGQAPCP